jgi:hypothetical protein
MDMQTQLQQQTRNLFGSFPFPNFGGTPEKPQPEPEKGPQERGRTGGGTDKT